MFHLLYTYILSSKTNRLTIVRKKLYLKGVNAVGPFSVLHLNSYLIIIKPYKDLDNSVLGVVEQ